MSIGNGIAALGICLAVGVGVFVTHDPQVLWALLALIFMVDA